MPVRRGIIVSFIFLMPVFAMLAGCGKDGRLAEHSGTYYLERGEGEHRRARTLEIAGDGSYSFEMVSVPTGEVLESGAGEWMIVADRMRAGGRAIILNPSPTNIVMLEIKKDGNLLETASDSTYEKQ